MPNNYQLEFTDVCNGQAGNFDVKEKQMKYEDGKLLQLKIYERKRR